MDEGIDEFLGYRSDQVKFPDGDLNHVPFLVENVSRETMSAAGTWVTGFAANRLQ